jgi:hypothetical protein
VPLDESLRMKRFQDLAFDAPTVEESVGWASKPARPTSTARTRIDA